MKIFFVLLLFVGGCSTSYTGKSYVCNGEQRGIFCIQKKFLGIKVSEKCSGSFPLYDNELKYFKKIKKDCK